MRNSTLPYKGYARIFVNLAARVDDAYEVLKRLDPDEFGECPEGFIVPYPADPGDNGYELVYLHKFELNVPAFLDLCWRQGILAYYVEGTARDRDYADPSFHMRRMLRRIYVDDFDQVAPMCGAKCAVEYCQRTCFLKCSHADDEDLSIRIHHCEWCFRDMMHSR